MNDQETYEQEEEIYHRHDIIIDKKQEPLRIDKFLINRLEQVSRNKIQNAAKTGSVLVNKQPVKSNYKVKPGDIVSVLLPNAREIELLPENIPLNVVYEDESLLVVNKPAGLVVHPGYGNWTGTLMNALIYHVESLQEQAKDQERPGLVHRIDKDTTGLLVVGKDEYTTAHLAKQFYDHSTKRSYMALVWGDLPDDEGTIVGNIGRHERYRKKMAVHEDGGKQAITHYKVLQRFGYVTLLQCQLETGRTHQIRVHFSHIGYPLFGDETYGGDKIVKGTIYTKYKQFVENCFKLLPRQALHAKSLGFMHPKTNKEVFFDSELPEDIQQVIDKWTNYRQSN